MVNRQEQDSGRRPANQAVRDVIPEPNKINASTPYDFNGKNLTPYGGLLPVITMLDKLGFQSLVEQTVTSKRIPRAMDLYRFTLGIVLGRYIGFPRLNQLRFIARDPILSCMDNKWAGARATTRKTKARKAISVCPAKACVFSGSQPHHDKSQSSVAWIAGREGN